MVQEYTGGYDDWMRMKGTGDRGPGTGEKASGAGGRSAGTGLSESGSKARKLSNKEQRELARFPSLIESLETEVAQFNLKLAEPSFYQQSGPEIAKVTNRLATLNAQLQTAYQRWEELESA